MNFQTVPLEHIYIDGELKKRALMNLDRFAQDDFMPNSEKTYRHKTYEWPGDNEGRLLLAHVLLSRCTHKTSPYFNEIIAALPSHLNGKGYFGDILPDGFISEQQIAGNSWVLRSLLEHYEWTHSDQTLAMIHTMLDNYLILLADVIHTYPFSEDVSNYKGKAEGSLIPIPYGKWYMSTDFGCLFIMLDGVTQAYALCKNARLKHLIDTMIDLYRNIDVRRLSFQTHATLSCMRGVIRYYEITEREDLLDTVQKYYRLYKEAGMTAAYTNYNWFNIPEFTEPCAVIDSFILAVSLWKATENPDYLKDAHNILYNGVYSGQRINGGFGCDVCAGVKDDFVIPTNENYEAWWCCSKRGAEFFFTAALHLCLIKENEIIFPIYESMTALLQPACGEILLKETSDFAAGGYVCVEVLKAQTTAPIQFSFFVPDYVPQERFAVRVNGKSVSYMLSDNFAVLQMIPHAGDKIELTMKLSLRIESAVGLHTLKRRMVLYHGPCLLGTRVPVDATPYALKQLDTLHHVGRGVYSTDDGIMLEPLHRNTYFTKDFLLNTKLQLTFPQGGS